MTWPAPNLITSLIFLENEHSFNVLKLLCPFLSTHFPQGLHNLYQENVNRSYIDPSSINISEKWIVKKMVISGLLSYLFPQPADIWPRWVRSSVSLSPYVGRKQPREPAPDTQSSVAYTLQTFDAWLWWLSMMRVYLLCILKFLRICTLVFLKWIALSV